MFTLPKGARVGVPLAVTLAVLGGCSGPKHAAAPAWKPAASPSAGTATPGDPPVKQATTPPGGAVASGGSGTARPAQTLTKGLTKAGISCQGWQHYAQTTKAHDSGACYLHEGDGGQQITVATYGTQKQATAASKKPVAGPGTVMVVGSKATYVCTSVTLCQRIVEKVGGHLVKIPSR